MFYSGITLDLNSIDSSLLPLTMHIKSYTIKLIVQLLKVGYNIDVISLLFALVIHQPFN